MALTHLTLTDFRSYAEADLALGPGFVILTGENGAGKTNVLEAVSLLAAGRGLRGSALGEMARIGGAGGFSVAARVAGNELGTGTLTGAPERRVVRVNGAAAAVARLGEYLSLVWLTPAQDRLFSGTAGERRRFLDRLVLALDATHAHDAARYEAAMRQRNRLLAEGNADHEWLNALELAMASHGALIAERRARLVAMLDQRLEAPSGVFARAGLALEGFTSGDLTRGLAASRALDAAAGRTLVGPHRQDLIVTHRDKALAAAQCSTGEQKALLIGIVLAHAELLAERQGRTPVLLLDEVAAHLDPRRRAALFERLRSLGGQVWMTGTEATLFDEAGHASRFTVAGGPIYAE